MFSSQTFITKVYVKQFFLKQLIDVWLMNIKLPNNMQEAK